MKNITQTQLDAKQAYLSYQQDQMLALYQKAQPSERQATIKQIDSFLSVISRDEKLFWLKFLRRLEVLNESDVLFPLGQIFLTIGAREALAEAKQLPGEFLARHQKGDWGDVCEDDKRENEVSIREGFRILSAYRTSQDVKLWVITEADRSSATVLLPAEY